MAGHARTIGALTPCCVDEDDDDDEDDGHLTVPQNYLGRLHRGDAKCRSFSPSCWLLCPVNQHFRSGREKFADFIFTKRTSHIPHVVFWFSLMFDCEVKEGTWLIHLQRTTASKFFGDINRATLILPVACAVGWKARILCSLSWL